MSQRFPSLGIIEFSSLKNIIFFIIIFFLTRQFPLSSYSWLMNFGCFLLILIESKNISNKLMCDKYVLLLITTLILFSFVSLIRGNDPLLVFRFSVITIFIVLSYYISDFRFSFVKLFFVVYIIQAIVVISVELYMYFEYGTGDYLDARFYFLSNDYGDVYTYGSGFYHIQLKGNALLPFAFMLSMFMYKIFNELKYAFFSLVFFIAIACAGNLAFFISIFIYLIYYNLCVIKNNNRSVYNFIFILITVLLMFFYGVNELLDIINAKYADGAQSSIGTRIDQYHVLLNDFSSNFPDLIFGKGFGNLIQVVTAARDYSNYIYYELQSIYFLNQMGLLVFSIFIIFNIYLSIKHIQNHMIRFIYCMYILYASTNPYIFDTNHLVVIITLVNLSALTKKAELL